MYIFDAQRVLIFEHLIVTIGKNLNFTLDSSIKQKTDNLQIKQILDISIISHVFTLFIQTKFLLNDALLSKEKNLNKKLDRTTKYYIYQKDLEVKPWK